MICMKKISNNQKPSSATLPTKYGNFNIMVWPASSHNEPAALITQRLDTSKPVLVRVHSECITGDTFGSHRCDCGTQKEEALKIIAKNGNGVFIYLRQEGRGIGLYEKIKAYKIQEDGYDTHEANILLGHKPDYREYSWVKEILDYLDIKEIILMTNNPSKVSEISHLGVKIIRRVPLVIKSNKHNRRYFESKRAKFKHFFGKDESNYFYQFCYAENSKQVEEIGKFIEGKKFDPLLKICVGTYGNAELLSDKAYIQTLSEIFKACELFEGFVPILHFTFKFSKNPLDDIKKIKQNLPFVRYIQLNDLKKADQLAALKLADKYFLVDFPLSDGNFSLINDPAFIRELQKKKAFIILDNSKGRGLKEEKENYIKKINKLFEKGINDIALCGGFGPGKLQTYFSLRNYYKINFSVDAESNLRTNGKLDLRKVKKYLSELLSYRMKIEHQD
jgi:GTP cyclohydrolase II